MPSLSGQTLKVLESGTGRSPLRRALGGRLQAICGDGVLAAIKASEAAMK